MVHEIDARAQLRKLRTIEAKMDDAIPRERLVAGPAGFFGIFSLTLSAMGLFGLLSYNVSRRTREMGVRMALGAPARGILLLVAKEGFVLGLLGCGLGLAGAFICTRFLASLLYGVPNVDPLTFSFAALLLLAVVLLACLLPAIRAAKVDPMVALRAE